MPELPEVETTARLIEPGVLGRRIDGVEVEWLR
ncbi:MAG: DNA-formamidopyrimidine glycosylase, partial [Planctomycetes bacterium]|nr:DNA-formamidopyrimidine glycosylase [Planctomycetota bacterium]